ncbi:MAG: hypothetical protein IT422_02280 [Pirellulaceae bacterium]|nr:hypothetical protein [Pirellulaceae bacterium]
MIAIFLLVLTSGGFSSESQQIVPGTAYRLTFEADGAAAGTPWEVHLRDAKGSLPIDGALEAEWQQLTPDKKAYTQLFYAPADATTFKGPL